MWASADITEETDVPKFIARVQFEFDSDDLERGGEKLRDLRTAASRVGFAMIRGRVDPAPDVPERHGPTTYGPTSDPLG